MNNTLLAVFTGILAFAVLMQSVLFFLTFLGFRKLSKDLLPQVRRMADKTEETLVEIKEIAGNIRPVAEKLSDSAEIIHGRVVDVDGFLGEIMETSRREIAGIEDTLHVVTQRLRDSISILSDTILMPVSRINALTKAVRVAAGTFFRRRGKAYEYDSSDSSDDDTIYF